MKTNYYFQVSTEGLYEVLDVFSHFFIDPTFNEEAVFKEVNAVNSEYEIDVSDDGWKLYHLLTTQTKKSHPLSKFSIGNLDSLNKDGVVDALKDYFQKYYSANVMALVIKSNLPIHEVEDWVRYQSDFGEIEDKKLEVPSYGHFGLPLPEGPSLLKFHTNAKSHNLVMVFQIDKGIDQYYRTKPMSLINKLITSKQENGLLHWLQSKQLARSIYGSVQNYTYT